MKKLFIWASIIFFSLSSAFTFAEDSDSLKVNLNTGIVSLWLGEPGGIRVYNRPAWRNEVIISKKYNKRVYYVGVWGSFGLNDKGISHKDDFGDEVDFFAGLRQSFKFSEIDLSLKYFLLNDFRKSDDPWIIDAQFDFPASLLTTYIAIRYWGETGKDSLERGWFFRPGVKRSFPVLKIAAVNLDTSLNFSDGPLGKKPGFICGAIKVSLDLKINDWVSLSPFVVLQIPAASQKGKSEDFTGGKDDVMFGVNIGFSF